MKLLPVAVLLLLCLCGCSPQKSLARRLKDADRVIFASNVPGYDDLKTTVTGEDVSTLVRAVANGRKLSPNVACSPESRLEFFKGPSHVATITNCVSVFWIGLTPYEDRSGMLEKLNQRRREEYEQGHLQ